MERIRERIIYREKVRKEKKYEKMPDLTCTGRDKERKEKIQSKGEKEQRHVKMANLSGIGKYKGKNKKIQTKG